MHNLIINGSMENRERLNVVNEMNMNKNGTLNELIKRVNESDISSIKEVIIKLISVINDPKSSAKDLKEIIVPTLVLQGDDDQVVPLDDSGRLSVKLVKNATLKVYPGYPHGMLTIHADIINPDLLAFIRA